MILPSIDFHGCWDGTQTPLALCSLNFEFVLTWKNHGKTVEKTIKIRFVKVSKYGFTAPSQMAVSNYIWLVVLTILKNISQQKGLSHRLWKITNVPNHQPDIIRFLVSFCCSHFKGSLLHTTKKTAGIRTLRTVELRGRLTSHRKIGKSWSCSKIFGSMVCISYIYIYM